MQHAQIIHRPCRHISESVLELAQITESGLQAMRVNRILRPEGMALP